MTIRRLPVFLVATALLAAGCGSSSKDEKEASSSSSTDTTQTSTITTDPPSVTPTAATATATEAGEPVTVKSLGAVKDGTDIKKEPIVPKQDGTAPSGELQKDLIPGTGAVAKSGDTLKVQYTGYSLSNGEKFDASWDRGAEPFEFKLGGGQVIQGWDKGIVGMKVGGRRELVIPPDLGYGAGGSGPIGPDETLIFVVDLVSIK